MLIKNFSSLLEEQTDKDSCKTELQLHTCHPIFEGHFPGSPVTPGVTIIQLFKEQAERFTATSLQLVTASNIKFLTVIDPQTDPYVYLESIFKREDELLILTGTAVHKGKTAVKLRLRLKKTGT